MSEAKEEPKDFKDGFSKGYAHGLNYTIKVKEKMLKLLKREKDVQPAKVI